MLNHSRKSPRRIGPVLQWLARLRKGESLLLHIITCNNCDTGSKNPQGWKPFTVKAPYLLCLAATSITFIAILEWLSHKSARDGAIAVSDLNGRFSSLASFTLLYLPTILAVCFSIAWSWVELDVKRLEPFFRLSAPAGASAEQSVLLQYPIEYLPLVPVKAARLRYVSCIQNGMRR